MKRFLLALSAAALLATAVTPTLAQTLRPDATGIPQPAPITGGGAPGIGTGNDVKIGIAGLTKRGLDRSVTLTLRGSGQRSTYNAGGRDVSIQGTGNNITLRGRVRHLTIVGKANRVTANAVETVAISGAGNAVTYRGGKKPTVELNDGHNQIRKAP